MCFGNSKDVEVGPPPRPQQHSSSNMNSNNPYNNYAPPQGPPPGYHQQQQQQHGDYAPPPGPPPSHQHQGQYAPPPGPPPGKGQQQYLPPPGLPPSHRAHGDYAPPPGPPPSFGNYAPPPGPPQTHASSQQQYAPPPGPPPGAAQTQLPKHDWETAVPDTSLLPPPPSFFGGYARSDANNANRNEAEAGEAWCRENALIAPMELDNQAHLALNAFNISLIAPSNWARSRNLCEYNQTARVWHIQTKHGCRDGSLFSYPPLYCVKTNSPIPGQGPKMIYYEVKFSNDPRLKKEVSVALGFSALPYPAFRLPGWHRASLGCHGDDGRRYINDRWGGKDFMGNKPFQKGQTVGIGMNFTPAGQGRFEVEVFLAKDGRKFGSWDLHEELDSQKDLPITGLEGCRDLAATIGVFDETDFQAFFHPSQWMYQEARNAHGFP